MRPRRLALWLLAAMCGAGGCASITIESDPPGAKTYLNGEYIGTTPFTQTFWAGQDAAAVAEIVAPGHDRSECVHLARLPGNTMMQIVSAPAGADGYIDGAPVGKLPLFTRIWFPHSMKAVWKAPAADAAPAQRPPGGSISCDLRVIRVADGSAVAEASGTAKLADLKDLAKALVDKLKDDMMVRDQSIAVASLRSRSGSAAERAAADELADKVMGALIATKWFDVKERIDLRATLDERDLETAELVHNPKLKGKLAGTKYIIIGGLTLDKP